MHFLEKKRNRYTRLYNQLCKLLEESPSVEAQMTTINAIVYHKIPYVFWVGFYLVDKNRLIVGPYQGPLACQKLEYPHGVCWHSIIQKTATIVPDVNKFPEHIACDTRAKSEIVIPVWDVQRKRIQYVFDLDSDRISAFDTVDLEGLERITRLLNI